MCHATTFLSTQRAKYLTGIIGEYTVFEMMDLVSSLIDESDPDFSLSNDIHMYQVDYIMIS